MLSSFQHAFVRACFSHLFTNRVYALNKIAEAAGDTSRDTTYYDQETARDVENIAR